MYRHSKQTMKEQCAMVTYMHKIMKMCKICIDRDFSRYLSQMIYLTKASCYYLHLNMHSWKWSNAESGFA